MLHRLQVVRHPVGVVHACVGHDVASRRLDVEVLHGDVVPPHVHLARDVVHLEAALLEGAHFQNANGHVFVDDVQVLEAGVDVEEFHVRDVHAVLRLCIAEFWQVHAVVYPVQYQGVHVDGEGVERRVVVLVFPAVVEVVDNVLQVDFVAAGDAVFGDGQVVVGVA